MSAALVSATFCARAARQSFRQVCHDLSAVQNPVSGRARSHRGPAEPISYVQLYETVLACEADN